MAMDILLTKPVLEDNNQETNKDVEDQIVKIEGRSAMDGHESLKPSSPNKKDSGVTNLALRSSDKACDDGNHGMVHTSENKKESIPIDEASQLESARADMVEVKEENERLKMILARIMKDYQTLQMHFIEISQQDDGARRSLVVSPPPAANTVTTTSAKDNEEAELVSLSLGSSSTSFIQKKVGKNANTINTNNNNISDTNNNIKRGDAGSRNGLSLGLDCKFDQNEDQSPENSYEELKVEEVTEGWPPNKLVKAERGVEDEVAQQAHVKKARVSVRARCDAPTMQDGCQWRKYGQKIAKGNPCPRAYYRCTVAPACPVRKQVQRCAEDMSILITTYEGTHNHPLTLQATAMASTTSAAASMLMSGSSIPAARTSASSGLIFDLSDNSRTRPFYLTNLSLSTPATYPTITLDLTSTSPVPQFSKLSSAFSTTPRYSSSLGMSNFNFSTDQNTFPASWNSSTNTNTSYFNYGSNQFKKSSILPPTLARPSHEQFYQAYLNKPNPSSSLPASGSSSSSQQNSDTIVAATKAITSDPSFRSALAAAITSIVSTNSSNNSVPGLGKGENALQNFTWGEQFSSPSPMAAYSSGGSVPGYGPSFLNRSSSANWDTQQGNLFQQATSLPFSSAKSTISSASRANDISKEHKN